MPKKVVAKSPKDAANPQSGGAGAMLARADGWVAVEVRLGAIIETYRPRTDADGPDTGRVVTDLKITVPLALATLKNRISQAAKEGEDISSLLSEYVALALYSRAGVNVLPLVINERDLESAGLAGFVKYGVK